MKFTKKRMIYTFIVTIIVVFSTTFAILMTLERTDYRNYLQGEYSKSMYDLITFVDNINSGLTKASIEGSKDQDIIAFEEIFKYSSIAGDKLSSLPIDQGTGEKINKFLSQIGDFSSTLVRKMSQGGKIEDKDYNTIDNLKRESGTLEISLNKTLQDINNGKIKWGEIRKKVSGVLTKTSADTLNKEFSNINKQVGNYPALIYDGPFSDNVQEIKPKVEELRIVSLKDAENTVKNCIGSSRISSMEADKSSSKSKIDTYNFKVYIKGRSKKDGYISCNVSRHGGKILYLLDNRNISASKLSIDKAEAIGNDFLKKIGYNDMHPMYALKYDNNTAVISYVLVQNSVTIYTDQIKLKVALDNGDITGIESEKYLTSHVDKRNNLTPGISRGKAQEAVGRRLNIQGVKLAIIPSLNNDEKLAYEFSGNYKGTDFKVYIDANTGYEIRILQIINTPNGKLAM